MQFSSAHRQESPPACIRFREGGKGFQVLRKAPPGQRRGEILLPKQFHAHARKGLFPDLQSSESRRRKTPRLKRQIGVTATQNIVNVRGGRPDGSPRLPKNVVQARAKR